MCNALPRGLIVHFFAATKKVDGKKSPTHRCPLRTLRVSRSASLTGFASARTPARHSLRRNRSYPVTPRCVGSTLRRTGEFFLRLVVRAAPRDGRNAAAAKLIGDTRAGATSRWLDSLAMTKCLEEPLPVIPSLSRGPTPRRKSFIVILQSEVVIPRGSASTPLKNISSSFPSPFHLESIF